MKKFDYGLFVSISKDKSFDDAYRLLGKNGVDCDPDHFYVLYGGDSVNAINAVNIIYRDTPTLIVFDHLPPYAIVSAVISMCKDGVDFDGVTICFSRSGRLVGIDGKLL